MAYILNAIEIRRGFLVIQRKCDHSVGHFEMDPTWIKNLLKLYSLFGFHSISFARFGGEFFSFFVFFIHIGLCMWITCWAIGTFEFKLLDIEFLDAINFVLFYLTAAITYWIIIYDSYTHQQIQRAFWNNFNRINQKFSSQSNLNKWQFLNAFFAFILIYFVSCIILFFRAWAGDKHILHYGFLFIYDHRVLFYLLHLKVIIFQLRKIQNELKNKKHQEAWDKWICEYFRLITEMVDHMNMSFGWSNLALTLLYIMTSISYVNFMYSLIALPENFSRYTTSKRKDIFAMNECLQHNK